MGAVARWLLYCCLYREGFQFELAYTEETRLDAGLDARVCCVPTGILRSASASLKPGGCRRVFIASPRTHVRPSATS